MTLPVRVSTVPVHEREGRLGDHLDGLGHVLAAGRDELVVDDAGRGDDSGRRQHVHRDAVLEDLGGQARGEALERGLAHPVDGAPAHAAAGAGLRVTGGAGGDVEDPAALALLHRRQHELGQLERRAHLDLEHEVVVPLAEPGHRFEEGDGGVVHEDVDGAELLGDVLDEAGPVLRLGQVGGDGDGLPTRLGDEVDRLGDGALEAAVAGLDRAGRDRDDGSLGGHAAGDGLTDPPARARDDRDLSFHGSHQQAPPVLDRAVKLVVTLTFRCRGGRWRSRPRRERARGGRGPARWPVAVGPPSPPPGRLPRHGTPA